MQTVYFPDDLLTVPDLEASRPFEHLKTLIARKRAELEGQGRATKLERIAISHRALRRVFDDPDFATEAKQKDQGGLRLKYPPDEILGEVLGLRVNITDPVRP